MGVKAMQKQKSRGERNADWIEKFCCEPSGPAQGMPVRLTNAERLLIRHIYDAPSGLMSAAPVSGPLAAYITLLHLCGREATQGKFTGPDIDIDIWSVWRATTEPLQAVLKQAGGHIICPELGTRYPAAA
jgi:hypothetical protein